MFHFIMLTLFMAIRSISSYTYCLIFWSRRSSWNYSV